MGSIYLRFLSHWEAEEGGSAQGRTGCCQDPGQGQGQRAQKERMLERECEALRIEVEKVWRGPRPGGQLGRHLWVFGLSHPRRAMDLVSRL